MKHFFLVKKDVLIKTNLNKFYPQSKYKLSNAGK